MNLSKLSTAAAQGRLIFYKFISYKCLILSDQDIIHKSNRFLKSVSGSTTELRKSLLDNFFNCKFPNLRQLFPNIHKGEDHYTDVKGNFVFRYKMARLCRPPFCHKDLSDDPKSCQSRCKDIQTNQARESCLENVPGRNKIIFYKLR